MSWYDEWEEPYRAWAEERGRTTEDAPEPRALRGQDDMAEWLSHPSNWRETRLFCVGWGDRGMWIAREQVRRIAPGHPDRDLLLQVIWRQHERRRVPLTQGSPSLDVPDDV